MASEKISGDVGNKPARLPYRKWLLAVDKKTSLLMADSRRLMAI